MKIGILTSVAAASIALSVGTLVVTQSAMPRETTTGPQGEQGIQGEQGLAGADGARGSQGSPGSAGADGSDGSDGTDGAQGPAGAAGPAGADGMAGVAGPAGAAGPQGAQGPAGAIPNTGIDSLFLPANQMSSSGTAIVATRFISNWPHTVLVVPPNTTSFSATAVSIPTSWRTAQSITSEVYYTTTTDSTSTWVLEHGLDGFAPGDAFSTDSSTETTVTPQNLGPDKIQKVTYTEALRKTSLANAEIFELILGRWNLPQNLNTGEIYIIGIRFTPNF